MHLESELSETIHMHLFFISGQKWPNRMFWGYCHDSTGLCGPDESACVGQHWAITHTLSGMLPDFLHSQAMWKMCRIVHIEPRRFSPTCIRRGNVLTWDIIINHFCVRGRTWIYLWGRRGQASICFRSMLSYRGQTQDKYKKGFSFQGCFWSDHWMFSKDKPVVLFHIPGWKS